jgi:purine catabolism regulator
MTLDVAAVAKLVNATIVGRATALNRPIDDVVSVDVFSVVAHTNFVSLVLISDSQLLAVLREPYGRLDVLRGAILVTTRLRDGSHNLRKLVEAAGLTVLFCDDSTLDDIGYKVRLSLATDLAAEARLVTAGTKVLTQVARRGGLSAVVMELAHRLNGWVVLLEKNGKIITNAGAGALHLDDAVAVALHNVVRVQHPGLQVHPIGEGEELRAFLVVASRSGTTSRTRDLAAQSAALIDLLLRTHDHTATERLGREVMMETLLAGTGDAPAQLLHRWGVREDTMTGFMLSSRTKSVDVERLILRWLDEMGASHVVTSERDCLVGLIRDDLIDELIRRVDTFVADAQKPLRCGIGSSVGPKALNSSVLEAHEAHEAALTDNRSIVRYDTLSSVQYVLKALDTDATSRMIRILDGLRDPNGTPGDLMETLRVFLAENGSWSVAARRLNVHRHTLTNRIAHIESLTDLAMDSPDDRALAWLALRALTHET